MHLTKLTPTPEGATDMGIFSKLSRRNRRKIDPTVAAVFEKIQKLLEDEEFQISACGDQLKELLMSKPALDRVPNGEGPFGFNLANPIPVNGPIGELAYLSRLETKRGERILFHRLGSIGNIDAFESVTFSGSEWHFLFLDYYHSRRSREAPEGFRLAKIAGQFSGFNKFCPNFPYDFADAKRAEDITGLRMAYIPLGMVDDHIRRRVYRRPPEHEAALAEVQSTLTGRQTL